MAVLTQPKSTVTYDGPIPEPGSYAAVCSKIEDKFQVTRKKFQSEETEVVDLTTFWFKFTDDSGTEYEIPTKSMLISGHEKSALFKFLKQWLLKPPPYGWDYCAMQGKNALIGIQVEKGKQGDREFVNISSISPLPKGMQAPKPAAPAAPPTDSDDTISF